VTDTQQRAFRELEKLYQEIEEQARHGDCRMCGACCHFRTFGHRLYATRLEALYLLWRCGLPQAAFGEDCCGYQRDTLCLARQGRVLGCRTFFCTGAAGRQQREHEEALARIRRIVESEGIEWDYRPLSEHIALLRQQDFPEVL